MALKIPVLIFVLFASLNSQAKLPEIILVNLFSTEKVKEIVIYPPAKLNNKILTNNYKLNFQTLQNKLFISSPINNIIKVSANGKSQRHYSGTLYIQKDFQSSSIKVTNKVNSLEYIKSVIASETTTDWPIEALKAQAVVIQTRLVNYKGQILPDSTEEGVYSGQNTITQNVEKAVNAVWGETLTQNKKPIQAFYHSTCAGKTSSPTIFSGELNKNFQSTKCNFCSSSPFWKTTITFIPIKNYKLPLPTKVTYDSSERPLKMLLANGEIITGYKYWLLLGQKHGWDKAPGLNFKVKKDKQNITIESRGAGHGIGLCQWGAKQMALQGKNYKQILQFYFPESQLH